LSMNGREAARTGVDAPGRCHHPLEASIANPLSVPTPRRHYTVAMLAVFWRMRHQKFRAAIPGAQVRSEYGESGDRFISR
jgi:hypothetical protein